MPSIADERTHRFGWFVMALVFLASVVNYLDRAILGVLMPEIRRDLALTNSDYALTVNAFLIIYTAAYIIGGRVADRLGSRTTFSITLLWWSFAAMSHAFVQGVATLALCRAFLGVGEGGYYPTAICAAAEWFQPAHRARAVGLILSSISIGTLLTPPIVAVVTLHYGWRAAFLLTGGAGLLLIPAWLFLHRQIHRHFGVKDPQPGASAIDAHQAASAPLTAALRSRRYWCLLSSRACADAAWYFYLFWMPGYFQEQRHLNLAQAGQLLWIPFATAGIGALFGAWAGTALILRGWPIGRSRSFMLITSALAATAGALACLVPQYQLALAIVSAALFGHTSFSSNIHTAITEASPAQHVAVLYGMTGAAGTLGGVLMQFAVGRMVDTSGYNAAFLLASILYATSIAAVLASKLHRDAGLQAGG
ncbi:MAG: MFS transporter [Bryobacteraceae bacterium]